MNDRYNSVLASIKIKENDLEKYKILNHSTDHEHIKQHKNNQKSTNTARDMIRIRKKDTMIFN
jgi:hypothetical protein